MSVIKFPFDDVAERFYRELEPMIRVGLFRIGAPAGMADWIIADMKPRVIAAMKAAEVPPVTSHECTPALKATFDSAIEYYQAMALGAIGQIILLEGELYGAKFLGGGGLSPGITADRVTAEIIDLFKKRDLKTDPEPSSGD
jgi:hypothetical protein